MQRRRFVLAATTALAAPAVVRAQETLKSAKAAYRLVTLSRDLVQPWGMAFLPDGRMLITERPGRLRVFANGRLEPRAAAGRAPGPCRRSGRPARCLPAPQLRAESRALSLLYRGRQQRHGDHGGPRRTGRWRPRQRQGDLRGPAQEPRQPQSRLAHRLRPRRADVCQHRRSLPDAAGAGSRRFRRQDRPPARRRLGAAGQSLRRQGRVPGRKSSPGATAIRRASRAIPRPAGSGRSSTGPRAATSSTS